MAMAERGYWRSRALAHNPLGFALMSQAGQRKYCSCCQSLLESRNSLTVYGPSGKCKTPSRKSKSKFPDGEPPGNNRQGWLDRDDVISLTVYRQENTILIS